MYVCLTPVMDGTCSQWQLLESVMPPASELVASWGAGFGIVVTGWAAGWVGSVVTRFIRSMV